MSPGRSARSRVALGVASAFVALLAVTGLALLLGAGDAAGRAFGAFELLIGLLILGLLVPAWRGPRS